MNTEATETDIAIEELRALVQDAPTTVVVAPERATSAAPYILAKKPVYIDLARDEKRGEVIRAYLGGPNTGLYERERLTKPITVKRSDGSEEVIEWTETVIVPWVAVKIRGYSEVIIRDGEFAETGNASYDVLVLAPHGQKVIRRMPAADTANIAKVLDAASSLGLPEPEAYNITRVRNMLRVLGAADCPMETEILVGGWADTEDGAAFIEPMGTTTEHGVSDKYRVKVEGADRYIGVTGISIVNATETLRRYFAVAPERLDLTLAGISSVMASCIGLKRRTTLYLAAQPGSGKSVMLTILMAWSNSQERDEEMSMSMESDDTASVPAIYARMAIVAGNCYFDDLMYSDKSAFGRINAISRAGYLSSVRSKSGNDGREREQVYGGTQTIAIVSAEAIPEGPQTRSIVERMVICQMLKGDLRWSDRDGVRNPVDVWKRETAEAANHLRGAFIQWLATKANRLGGARALREWADGLREKHRMAMGGGEMTREADVVSVLAAGWDAFTQFLAESGIELPVGQDAVDAALHTLLMNSQQRGAEANPVRRMLEHIRDSTSDGYFTDLKDTVPGGTMTADEVQFNPGELGWRFDEGRGWSSRGGQHFGYVSQDGQYALLLPAAIKWAKRTYDPTRTFPLNDTQVGASLDDLMQEGMVVQHTYSGTARTSLKLGFNGKRGVVVPLSWLLSR